MRGIVLLLASVALAAAARDDQVPLAPAAIKPLEKEAKELAKAGRAAELDELLEILRRAGMEPAVHEKLARTTRLDVAKAKKVQPAVPSTAKSLQKVAADLAVTLDGLDEARRRELARLVLRLHGSNEAAHRALGREKAGDAWLDEIGRARRERGRKIELALARSRGLTFEIRTGKSEDVLLAAAKQGERSFASYGPVTLHGVWPQEKLARMLLSACRALAVINFLMTDSLSFPGMPRCDYVYFDRKSDYDAALDVAVARGWMSEKELDLAKKLSGMNLENRSLGYATTEAGVASSLLCIPVYEAAWKASAGYSLYETQRGLVAGLLNWTALSVIGTRLPLFLVEKEQGAGAMLATVGLDDEQRRERERLLLLSEAGLLGGRAWMQYLAEHRSDPSLVSALREQLGEVQGQELLKVTFVVEMLAQDGPLLPFFRKLPAKEGSKSAAELCERATGRTLAELESEWREWLLPPRRGLAERLAEAPRATKLPVEQAQAIARLNELRRRVDLTTPVDSDEATSASCMVHARYLAQNPEQMRAWPDAHEEYPDRPGFDPAGAWAGGNSVIAPGAKDAGDAIEGWMATFYHRLPLLDPGLVRIGVAVTDVCTVLDSGTFVRPRDRRGVEPLNGGIGQPLRYGIVWPPPGGSEIPTRFQSELPEPIPGEDSGRFGYPITFQLRFHHEPRPDLELVLHEGAASGPVVECWLSTPTAPTNPVLAPDHTWCLIPKAPLRSGGSYTVTGALTFPIDSPYRESFSWSFRCK